MFFSYVQTDTYQSCVRVIIHMCGADLKYLFKIRLVLQALLFFAKRQVNLSVVISDLTGLEQKFVIVKHILVQP